MNERKFFVYLLRRKDTNQVVYVGETDCPERRFNQHMEGKTPHTAPIISWAKGAGVDIGMQLVGEFATRQESLRYESQLVERARHNGYWLANLYPVRTAKLRRSGKPWTDKERKQLHHMYEVERMPIMEMAQELQRPFGAITAMLKKQGYEVHW